MDSSPHHEPPQRMSALYQYHNAPEVAPAHGLEYDDSIHPSSDKYPVVREFPYIKGGKYGFGGDNRPPRIIFGMKVRTFLLVAAVMTMIVVGAAVGGAVGGQQLRDDQQAQSFHTNGTNLPAAVTSGGPSQATATSSTFSAPTPTYTALSDCPDSNNTKHTSEFWNIHRLSGSGPKKAGFKFTKYCDKQNPLSEAGAQRIAEAFVYTFSDCIDVCAGYNFYNGDANCTVAVYQPLGSRPGNCFVGHVGAVQASHLNVTQGTDVALLNV